MVVYACPSMTDRAKVFMSAGEFIVPWSEHIRFLKSKKIFGEDIQSDIVHKSPFVGPRKRKRKRAPDEKETYSSLKLSMPELMLCLQKNWVDVVLPPDEDGGGARDDLKDQQEQSVAIRRALMTLPHDAFIASAKNLSSAPELNISSSNNIKKSALSNKILPQFSTHSIAQSLDKKQASRARHVTFFTSLECSTLKTMSSSSSSPSSSSQSSFRTSTNKIQVLSRLKELVFKLPMCWEKCLVFYDLWSKGFFVTSDMRFGTDFLVYRDHPSTHHSSHLVKVVKSVGSFNGRHLSAYIRMAGSVKKDFLIAFIEGNTAVTCWIPGKPMPEIEASQHHDGEPASTTSSPKSDLLIKYITLSWRAMDQPAMG